MMSGFVFFLSLVVVVHGLRLEQDPDRVTYDITGDRMGEAEGLQSESDSTWKQMTEYMQALGSQNTPEIHLLQNLKPCAKCGAPKRYGEKHDGGYAMCSELIENGTVTAGYSIGINGRDAWGKHISSSLHVPVYQFDCTNKKRPNCRGGTCKFYDLCVTANQTRKKSKPKYMTMLELMALNGHGKRGDVKDLILQIDVESYEWDLFADPSTAEQMAEFSQVSVEFHGLLKKARCCKGSPIETKLKALENLNRMFVVTHLHGNNFAGSDRTQDPETGKSFSVPNVLEVLYVRRGLLEEQQCSTDPRYLPQDRPNKRKKKEVPPPHLP